MSDWEVHEWWVSEWAVCERVGGALVVYERVGGLIVFMVCAADSDHHRRGAGQKTLQG